jgi:exodeoxyribonuclease-3
MLKLATWNVNSIKIRLDHLLEWMDSTQVDVIALQETKIVDELFPREAFLEKGWHVTFTGQKSYNGVALVSRFPLSDIHSQIVGYDDPQKRILAATIEGIRVINLYVPNGSAVGSEKYEYKLQWLDNTIKYIENEMRRNDKVAVMGDFNIAPEDIDVHDPEVWDGGVMVSPLEREAFQRLLGLGLKDSFRTFTQESVFSWWDYRAGCFHRNMGLRIDHILLSEALHASCVGCEIDKAPRRLKRPSDHAPVFVTLT